MREYRIYRWNPDDGKNPRIDTYFVDTGDCGPMVLDALIWIKNNIDPTLTFRRSCREGVCGSCAMNIDGTQHARLHQGHGRHQGRGEDLSAAAPAGGQGPRAGPDQFLRPVRLDPAVAADHDPPTPQKEWRQSHEDRVKLDGLYECILCACCSTSCPSYWWNSDRFLGPAALLQAARWLEDSRDEATGERLDDLEDPFRLYRCHTIMNCAKACPKHLNPAEAIAEIKRHDGRAEGLMLSLELTFRPLRDFSSVRSRASGNPSLRGPGSPLARGRTGSSPSQY